MISMLSQLSSSQDKITPFQYEQPRAPKTGMWTTLAGLGAGILFAMVLVNGVHGIAQAFGVA
jgi:hypothetical protein